MMKLILPLVLVCCAAKGPKLQGQDFGKIVFASIVFRHGDRSLIATYPKDPYRNESMWPAPFGELTNTGKNQHLQLGRLFRKRYCDILPDHYSYRDIYVQSTNYDRTLMSAAANMAGLYPPKGEQVWSELEWMPVPIHTVPMKLDYLLLNHKPCPRYDAELKKVRGSPEMARLDRKNNELYEYLTKHTGRKTHSVERVFQLYDVLSIEKLYNLPLPDWTNAVFPHQMLPLAQLHFELLAYNEVLQRLKAGKLLGEIMHHMLEKTKKTLNPDRKLWVYSAHDDNIISMLKILGIYYPHMPTYTASIMIELRINSRNQYVVTVFYKLLNAEPTLMTVPGCGAVCPLQKFIKLLHHLIPEDWDKECALDYATPVNYSRALPFKTKKARKLRLKPH